MCVYSCAEADKPSSRAAGIRCMLISQADSLLALQGLGRKVRYYCGRRPSGEGGREMEHSRDMLRQRNIETGNMGKIRQEPGGTERNEE